MTDANAIAQRLKTDEGFRSQPYRDSRGFETIGYGFLIDPAQGGGIPQPIADYWLQWLVNNNIAQAQREPWFAGLDNVRQDLIVCLLYNMGQEHLDQFKQMEAALTAHDYNTSAQQLQSSAWYNQVGQRGSRYVTIMRTGVWQ